MLVGSDAHIAPFSLTSSVMVGNPCEGSITPYGVTSNNINHHN